jgi:hypothetical protein
MQFTEILYTDLLELCLGQLESHCQQRHLYFISKGRGIYLTASAGWGDILDNG